MVVVGCYISKMAVLGAMGAEHCDGNSVLKKQDGGAGML